jgi:hypothetical protein
LCLVKHYVAHVELGNITHVKCHDVVVTDTNIVLRGLNCAIDRSIDGGLDFLDHLENIAHLGGIQGGA